MSEPAPATRTPAADDATYTVVARRYRPKTFDELVGQDHISQALGKAIATGRVGHAYLFTGARGVGKTSSARIFAKALNAPVTSGSKNNPDSDVSDAIDTGDDVDVIEIDAASNRGIDEIRQLRANVSVRPSRSRYKIYIIDEVHMLTNQAFNALLKTLEEPPEHVKFIFCTTDPEKVPITVLSRCQRFDFAPVRPEAIKQRLAEICTAEGFEAEDDALALLARRAAGSMRDSQSLLEQVMSFSSGKITTEQVHALLGTADETRLRELAEALSSRDGVAALKLVDRAINEGTDAGQFAEQMLGYLRDLMAVAVGGGPDLLKVCNPTGFDSLKQMADAWGLQTILAAVQLLDESLVRMRFSVQSQALFEVALIQISQLQDLATIAKIIEAVQNGTALPGPRPAAPRVAASAPSTGAPNSPPTKSTPAASAEKKNVEGLDLSALNKSPKPMASAIASPTPAGPSSTAPNNSTAPMTKGSGTELVTPRRSPQSQPAPPTTIKIQAAPLVDGRVINTSLGALRSGESMPTATNAAAGQASVVNANSSGQSPEATAALQAWRQASATTEGMLADFAGRAMAVDLRSPDQWTIVFPPGNIKTQEYCEVPVRKAELQTALDLTAGRVIQFGFRVQPGQAIRSTSEVPVSATVARSQRMRQISEHPLVNQLCTLLQGEIVRVDPPAERMAAPHLNSTPAGDANSDSAVTQAKELADVS